MLLDQVVVTSAFCTKTSEAVFNIRTYIRTYVRMCCCIESDVVSSDFVKRFDCINLWFNPVHWYTAKPLFCSQEHLKSTVLSLQCNSDSATYFVPYSSQL